MKLRVAPTFFGLAAMLCLVGIAQGGDPAPNFKRSPRLATTPEELAAEWKSPGFPARREAVLKVAEGLVADPPPLPTGFGSWTFYYACPDDGTDLRPLSPLEHECPKCKKRYGDERTVAAYRGRMHYRLDDAALRLGWAYAYTHDERFAAGVRRILLHLADAYDAYPSRLDRWGRRGWFAPLGGRRYVQSLDEAVGVIDLAKAYDLTREAKAWQAADAAHVEKDFFRATADTLLWFNQGINNHQTWYDAGLMAIASVLADAELVEKTLTMHGGFYDQLQRSFGDDGLWYEGAMAYQNYALQALVATVDAGRRLGLPLHESPRFRLLIASSLKVAYPDGTYPAINDSDPSSFRSFAWSYDWAWRIYGEPRFAQAAAWGDPRKLAEMLGPEAKPEWPLETKTVDLSALGITILRAGSGPEQACVFFDYGKHGDGHGHYDKLNITLFANGREWLLDPGRIGYSHQEYKTWVKHTVAHNTVVVEEADQAATTGKLLWLKVDDAGTTCAAECRSAYSGVTLRRSLRLTPKMLVDLYEVAADRPVQLDWLAHAKSATVEPVAAAEAAKLAATPIESLGRGVGYRHLTAARSWPSRATSTWDFTADALKLRVWCRGDAAEEAFTAVGIGQTVDQKTPTLLRRRRAAEQARFVTVYDLSGNAGYVTGLEPSSDADPDEVVVRTTDGVSRIRFAKPETK
ncbi:MAG: heparinase II/III family protein [Planctomycetia bacterium]|nr:heparinase II/III family protein [Planctomycetia bacterium]